MTTTKEVEGLKFTAFFEAQDLPDIISSFTDLCHEIHLDPNQCEDFYTSLKQKLQHWKSKTLWQLLDSRAALSEYQGQTVCKGKRVLIVGAGPVGLRSAIEAALLGAKVDIVEKRDSFSRNNVVHLWPFAINDLRGLGVKLFYPKFCPGAIDHISIKKLQGALLKVCLVLGVKIHFPVTFQDIIEPQDHSDYWHVKVEPSSSPISSHSYDAIISADGKQYSLPGFRSKEFRAKLAIAITVNFVNHRTTQEARVEELGGISFMHNQSFFKDLAQKHGIDLENIVYFKDETHYFVMTAKKTSLLAKGVIKNDYKDSDSLLARKNIDQKALENYAKEAASFSTKGGLGDLEFALNHREEHDVAIFDFTSMFISEHASRIVERKGKRLLLCVAGDSLIEPFWPTGTGIGRGFLGAFDAAWMLKRFSEGVPPIELIKERESIFQLLSSMGPGLLQKKISAYTIDPCTRYIKIPRTQSSAISHLYDHHDSTLSSSESHVLHVESDELLNEMTCPQQATLEFSIETEDAENRRETLETM